MARKVYVVTGSEDGTLGVASSVKQACEVAERYLSQGSPNALNGQDPQAWERALYRDGQLTIEANDGSAHVLVDGWELGWFGEP